MPRFTTLYSGSSGNAGVLEEDGRFLLIDMGAACRKTVNGLGELGLDPQNLAGVLVTHEHIDHVRGLQVFLKKYPVPVYAGLATLDALWQGGFVPPGNELVAVDGRREELAGFMVQGFATSHDAAGCCGFRITTPKGGVMALATDLGKMTSEVFSALHGAQLVALEANYDREMLRTGSYPPYLKRRIASPRGHLSNDDSAATVAQLAATGCRHFMMCHLSLENNMPEHVRKAVDEALYEMGLSGRENCTVQIARRHEVSDWIEF